MKHFTIYMLVIVFAIMFGISLSTDDCFYFGNHHGKKCFVPNSNEHRCCSLDHHCVNGQCLPFGATPPSKSLPFSTEVVIGVGVSVFCIVGLVIGAIYWHRRQMNNIEKQLNPLSSFSQSINASSRSSSSAGFRIHSSTSKETSVNLEPPIYITP